jgi:hypothetical protein
MRLSFSLLEKARKNPSRFGRNLPRKPGGYNSKNFRAYLFGAIKEFHRGKNKAEVVSAFELKCETTLQHQAQFRARLVHYTSVLAEYCDTFALQRCDVIELNKRATLTLGQHCLTGRIERFDMRLPNGYRATTTQLYDDKWEAELRWPLMQKAIAQELNCSASEVEVGVFCLETGTYRYRTFTDSEIASAVGETQLILAEVEAHLQP